MKDIVSAALVVLCLLFVYISDGRQQTSVFPNELYGSVPVYTDLVASNTVGRPGIKRKIKYIVIHETANTNVGSNAANHSKFLQEGGNGAVSWHYTVDDREVYHHIPDDEVAWHASDGRKENGGNINGIGIELCVNADGDFEKTLDNGAKLTAYLLRTYKLGIDAVKQHGDFVSKNCPQHIRDDGRWDEFLTRVSDYLKVM